MTAPASCRIVLPQPAKENRNPERRAQVAELTRAGLIAADIAKRLGITQRAVVRHRAAIRDAIREAAEVGA